MDDFIRRADVFHCNFAQAAYEHLGVTEEQLRRIMKEEGVRQEDIFLLTVNKQGAVNLIEREKDL